MSLKTKLSIIFLAMVSLPLFFVNLISFDNYKKSLEIEKRNQLENILLLKTHSIEQYFQVINDFAKLVQRSAVLRQNLPVLHRRPGTSEFRTAMAVIDDVWRNNRPILNSINLLVLDKEGKAVYAANPNFRIGNDSYFSPGLVDRKLLEGKQKFCLSGIFLEQALGGKPTMMFAVPAWDLENRPSGIIALEADLGPVYRLLRDVSGLGKTGETILGRKKGNEIIFLTPLRHNTHSALERRIALGSKMAVPIQQAIAGKTGSGLAIDYRGQEVVAAWRHIPSLNWGIVGKIDEEEAFAAVSNLKRLMLMILAIVLIISGLITHSIAQSITMPLKKLSQDALAIGSGNLYHRAGTNLKDEIGQLSRSFDKMAHDLRMITASRDELNREIIERKRAEESLRQSDLRLAKAQEMAHLGSWELDLEKDLLSWSDEVYRIFGLQPQEFQATYEAFLEAVHPQDRQTVDAAYSESIQQGRDAYEIEHRVMRKNSGEIRVVHEKAEHFRDESGKIVRSIGMVHDITERKMIETERETTIEFLHLVNKSESLRSLIESALAFLQERSGFEAIGIRLKQGEDYPYFETRGFPAEFVLAENHLCSLDTDGKILHDNSGYPIMECMCGNIICGRSNPAQFFFTQRGSFWSNCTTELLATSAEGDRQPRTRNRCNGEGYESVGLFALNAGADRLGLLQLNDRRKGMFSPASISLWERFADYLGVAIAKFKAEDALQRAVDDLARSNKDLEQFAYAASHDLQEPLRAVAGFMGLLRHQFQTALDRKANEYIDEAIEGAERMQNLINDLLAYSRVGRMEVSIQPIPLQKAVDGALKNLQFAIAEKDARITCDPLPIVQADFLQLVQLLQNLIGNAIKFRGSAPPEIHISAKPENGNWVIAVRDNGIGIESQYFNRIFLIFQRLHTRGKYQGSGIGLAICKRIAERHGGRLWVESAAGKGSTFYFTIPGAGE